MPASKQRKERLARDDYATLDDADAVLHGSRVRRVQVRNYSCETALPKDMARFLNIAEQGAPIRAELVKGTTPVLVEEPAIIIHPCRGGSE
jgi:hypothetical protein